jgi:hypothetical protein
LLELLLELYNPQPQSCSILELADPSIGTVGQ